MWEAVASFDNLWEAARLARRGKRFRHAAALFDRDLGPNLLRLLDQLRSGAYRPGGYSTFTIFEPARRLISAAPYRDRVVHHALCQVIEPIFERGFIFDSYANRRGKGTHAALDRVTHYARRFPYVLQGDLRLFFPSLDHQILLDRLRRRLGSHPRVMDLCALILANSNPQEPAEFYFPGDDLFTPSSRRRGLPIGNLTSQFWANVYLDPFDHFVKDDCGVKGYVRYVDDFLLFAEDKAALHRLAERCGDKLASLRLPLHPRKTRIYPVTEGIPFLGFRVWPSHRRLLPGSVKRARRRLARLETLADGVPSIRAWIAHAAHGNTYGLRRTLLAPVSIRSRARSQAVPRHATERPPPSC